MSFNKRAFAWLVIALAAIWVSFAVGHWSGSLKTNLESEVNYPWALHRKIGDVNIQCDNLLRNPTVGDFFVQPIDDGATLVIATFDKREGIVKAFALDPATGAIAFDNWPLECK